MNIAKILKTCPKGTKLWSPVCGDCTLLEVTCNESYPIVVDIENDHSVTFTAEGRYLSRYKGGECLLFPSKENRDWTEFSLRIYKPGDFVYFKTLYDWICIFKERAAINGNTWIRTFLSYAPEGQEIYGLDSSQNVLCPEEGVMYSRFATEQEKAEVLEALAKKGYAWDAKNLEVVKKAYEFKPYDRVLVRDRNSDEWRCDIFSHTTSSKRYYGKYVTSSSCWNQCIPYEGNEHLLGTTNNPDYSL